jgi:uncharacterized protein YdeI (YjbR/CyaY-like superfamily)
MKRDTAKSYFACHASVGGQDLEVVEVDGSAGWRSWLRRNHLVKAGAWLVFRRAGSKGPSISYDEALDEALAYGWIDSVIRTVDESRYVRKFSPRRPGSIWSKSNIGRVERLLRDERMTKWGLEAYEKRTGEISMLEKINAEGAVVPFDLEAALRKRPMAWANFERMPPSHRKRYLVWIAGAKRPETRRKRIAEAAVLIGRNVKNLLK